MPISSLPPNEIGHRFAKMSGYEDYQDSLQRYKQMWCVYCGKTMLELDLTFKKLSQGITPCPQRKVSE